MTTTLVTGANKGLGLETARQLFAAGHTVYIGSRDAERGRLAAEKLGARAIQLDITDDASVLEAVQTIEADGGLDVLVNNAAIEERSADNGVIGPVELTVEVMRKTFDTNVFGTVRVINAFLPLLQRSATPVVVNVSSGLGSLTQFAPAPANVYPGVAYPAPNHSNRMVIDEAAMATGIALHAAMALT